MKILADDGDSVWNDPTEDYPMTSSKDELTTILKALELHGEESGIGFSEVGSQSMTVEQAKAALSTYIAREKTAAQLHRAFTDLEAMQNGDSDYEWVLENQRAEVERLDQRLKRIGDK